MSDADENRTETARLIYEEAKRLRDLQDKRVDDVRQRSIAVLSLVTSAVVVVIGLTKDSIATWGLIAIAVAVAMMILGGVLVHRLFGDYQEGPNIYQLANTQYANGDPAHQVMRDLAWYHYDHYNHNQDVVLDKLSKAFTFELGAAAVVVLAVVLGLAL